LLRVQQCVIGGVADRPICLEVDVGVFCIKVTVFGVPYSLWLTADQQTDHSTYCRPTHRQYSFCLCLRIYILLSVFVTNKRT